jgi:hypothetical protein
VKQPIRGNPDAISRHTIYQTLGLLPWLLRVGSKIQSPGEISGVGHPRCDHGFWQAAGWRHRVADPSRDRGTTQPRSRSLEAGPCPKVNTCGSIERWGSLPRLREHRRPSRTFLGTGPSYAACGCLSGRDFGIGTGGGGAGGSSRIWPAQPAQPLPTVLVRIPRASAGSARAGVHLRGWL